MCGLIGVAGDVSHEIRGQSFRDMLDVCQVRGRDSTGVIKVDRDQNYDWVRQIGPPSNLYNSPVYENTIERGPLPAALIAHTRHKTSGDVSVKNAHPFDYAEEGICGVHNGTLNNVYKLDGYHHSKVDSDVLYNHLAINGAEETFSKIEGAWACVWWNDKEKTLNFIRNDRRPLFFSWSDDMKMMFWASEIWMFGSVARKIKLWDGGEDKQKYVELPVNTLWSFKINPKATGKEKVIRLRTPKVITPFDPSTRNTIGFHGGNNYHYRNQQQQRWREESPGNFSRQPEQKAAEKTTKENETGGSVVRPFSAKGKELNDTLKGVFEFQEEGTNTQMSNVSFLNTSARSSDTSQGHASTKRSWREKLFPRGTNSKNSQPRNKGVHSGMLDASVKKTSNSTQQQQLKLEKSSKSSHVLCKGVSFRSVAGMPYITDNRTKAEYQFEEFNLNTGGMCSCCKEPFDLNLTNVGEFLDSKTVLCKTCIENPSERVLVSGHYEHL